MELREEVSMRGRSVKKAQWYLNDMNDMSVHEWEILRTSSSANIFDGTCRNSFSFAL